jgi:hypothetical protein
MGENVKHTLKDNDVFLWRWKEGKAPIVGCYAHLAVVVCGVLRDTYWHDYAHSSYIYPENVDLTFLGNIDDCDVIRAWDVHYYDPADIIDMNHRNNSRAAIYLKRGAVKSQRRMLEWAELNLSNAQSLMNSATRDVERWSQAIAQIKAGDLEVVL